MQYTVLPFILKMFTNNKPFKNPKNGEEKRISDNHTIERWNTTNKKTATIL